MLYLTLGQTVLATGGNESGEGSTTTPNNPTSVTGEFALDNPLKADGIGGLINGIVKFIIGVSTALLTIFILYGAFQLMTSAGNPERVDKGRKTIFWAILGFVILLVAGGTAAIIADILGGTVEPIDGTEIPDSPVSTFEGIINVMVRASQWMFGILIALGTVMVLYSAFLYLFSGGNTERIDTARKTLVWAIVAMVVAVLAGGIGALVQNFVGVTGSGGEEINDCIDRNGFEIC